MLIGIPNPKILAQDLFDNGFRSCVAAEAAGWLITDYEPTRELVDLELELLTLRALTDRVAHS